MRIPVVVGNWKMYQQKEDVVSFIESLTSWHPQDVEIVICAPFVFLPFLVDKAQHSFFGVGAQNAHWEKEGAYTGEVSVPMLSSIGVRYVIIGHSERRSYFGETDEMVNKKVRSVIAGGLTPILCVGESAEEREAGMTDSVVSRQLFTALEGLSPQEIASMIIAYEPVWAIGTGESATPKDAQTVIGRIRKVLEQRFGINVSNQVRIQYGGSVKPDNIHLFMDQPDIDGVLVGGASVKPDSFKQLLLSGGKWL